MQSYKMKGRLQSETLSRTSRDAWFLPHQNASSETAMEEEMGLVGAAADDTEAELIRGICEQELLDGKAG